VNDPVLRSPIDRIDLIADPALDARGHSAVDLTLNLVSGTALTRKLDIAPGFPGADLSDAQHLSRFDDCLAYAPKPLAAAQRAACLTALERLSYLDDARQLVRLLVV